jgi:hypothetical protein
VLRRGIPLRQFLWSDSVNLYYWPEFGGDYTPGIAFAIAETEQQAKKIVVQQYYLETGNSDDDKYVLSLFDSEAIILPVESGIGRYCLGGG